LGIERSARRLAALTKTAGVDTEEFPLLQQRGVTRFTERPVAGASSVEVLEEVRERFVCAGGGVTRIRQTRAKRPVGHLTGKHVARVRDCRAALAERT